MSDYPHQCANASRVIARLALGANGADWSETGTGKTRTALRVIRLRPAPTLVVTPRISRRNWEIAGTDTGTEFDWINWELLRYGTSPYGWWERRRRGGLKWDKCEPTDKRDADVWFYRFTFHPGVRRVVWDEFHRAKACDSLNANMVRGACRLGLEQLAMSATPAADPTEMRALGSVLGWFKWDEWFPWALRNGCWRPLVGGLKFLAGPEGDQYLDKIRVRMVADGVKTSLREVHPDNALVVNPQLITLTDSAVAEATKLWARAEELEEHLRIKQATAASVLAERIAIRRRLEILKLPATVERATDLLAAGRTVLLFVNFRETITALSSIFPEAGVIHGDVSEPERQKIMADVREGRTRNVVLQNQAGSESINMQDVSGLRPVTSLVSLPESAFALIQIKGRTDRLGSKSTPVLEPIFAAGTLEEKIWRKVSKKSARIEDLTDSDLTPR